MESLVELSEKRIVDEVGAQTFHDQRLIPDRTGGLRAAIDRLRLTSSTVLDPQSCAHSVMDRALPRLHVGQLEPVRDGAVDLDQRVVEASGVAHELAGRHLDGFAVGGMGIEDDERKQKSEEPRE